MYWTFDNTVIFIGVCMDFDYNNVLVMGYGVSGKSVVNILKSLGVNYKVYDNKKGYDIDYNKLSKKVIKNFDLVILSPGISINNKYVRMAKSLGIEVIGELEFGYWFNNSNIIAITGTNGKTTTTKLVNDIIKNNFTSNVCGNIGNPLSNEYSHTFKYLVCEVSSFQLESVVTFKPNISIILNIAEDHIDRHKTFQNYIDCKLNLFKNNNEKSISVLNGDDELLLENTKDILGSVYYFSKYKKVKGVYLEDGIIYSNVNGIDEKIVNTCELKNNINFLDNILVGILVGEILKIERGIIIESIKNFTPSNHRLENVLTLNNTRYVNDSKSTNIHSTKYALEKTKGDIVLLLGGKNKKLSFDEIFGGDVSNIKCIIAFGSARKDILKSAKKFKFQNIITCSKFYDGVKQACKIAGENSTVLLSPGCASFDEFNSYAERGDLFTKLVKEFNNVKE